MQYKTFFNITAVTEFLIGLSAVWGGYGLITTNGLGMPIEWLSNSPFNSYLWPGMILAFVIGGTYFTAAFYMYRRHEFAAEFSGVAGFGLLIWIFTEMYIIRQSSWMQALYFILGIMTLLASMATLKYWKR